MFMWAVATSVVMVVAASIVALAWRTHMDIDIHSGRERTVITVGPFELSAVERDTGLSRLVADAGVAPAAPEWRRFHTAGGDTRIHYRYGDVAMHSRFLPEWMDSFGVAQPDQFRIARLIIQCLEQGRAFRSSVEDDGHALQIQDDLGDVIASVPMQPP